MTANVGRSARPVAALVLVALVTVSACGGSASASAVPPSAPSATVGAPPTSTPAARASATPKGDASPTPWATTAAGDVLTPGGQTGRVSSPDQKYAVTIPDGWQTLPVAGDLGPDDNTALAGIAPADLQVWRSTAAQNGSTLLAIDLAAAKDGKIIGFAVARLRTGDEQNLDLYATQVAAAIPKEPGVVGTVDSKPIATSGGPAYRIAFRVALSSLGPGPNDDQSRLTFMTGTVPYMYFLICQAPWSDGDATTPVFDKVMADFVGGLG